MITHQIITEQGNGIMTSQWILLCHGLHYNDALMTLALQLDIFIHCDFKR